MALSILFRYALAFTGGFNIMLLEMCAFRVLQTAFGSSIHVTGALLALVMVALALGYHIGGRLSRRPGATLAYLQWSALAAVAYVFVVHVWLGEPILDGLFDLRASLGHPVARSTIPGSLATVVLYLPPMLALAQIGPYLVRHLVGNASDERRGDVSGAVAGNVMAVSTVGSIAGTLLPSFLLIPAFGVPGTLIVFEVSTLIVAAAGLLLLRRPRRAIASGVAGAILVLGAPSAHTDEAVVYQGESMYGHIQIRRVVSEQGVVQLELKPSRLYVHSSVAPFAPTRSQYGWVQAIPALTFGAHRILVLGAGLGEIPALVASAAPDSDVTAVEIDPEVVALSRRHVPAMSLPNVELVVEDARVFLRQGGEPFDAIVVDLFHGDQPPAHCVTREFFELARARLRDGGTLFVNTNMPEFYVGTGRERPVPRPIRHLQAAIRAAGFPSLFTHELNANGFLYAFTRPIGIAEVRAAFRREAVDARRAPAWRTAAALAAVASAPLAPTDARPFTDDWSPELVIQRKENALDLSAEVSRAWREDGGEAIAPPRPGDRSPPDAHHLFTRLTAEWGKEPFGGEFDALMRGPRGQALCRDLIAWVSATTGPVGDDLARYLLRRDFVPACATHLAAPAAAGLMSSPRARALRGLVEGAAAGLEDRTDHLDALLAGLDQLY